MEKINLLKRFSVWFLSGFGLSLGIAAGFVLYDQVSSYFAEKPEYLAQPEKIKISDLKVVPFTNTFTLSGLVENSSGEEIGSGKVFLSLRVNGIRIYSCHAELPYPPLPGSKSRREFPCGGVDIKALTPDVIFDAKVYEAVKKKKP